MFPTQGLNQRHSADTSNSADYPINYKPSKASLNYIAKLNYRKQRVLAVISRRATAFSRDYIQTQDDIPVIVDRNKTVVRSAGGEIWNDSRLLEWDKSIFIFI